MGRPEALRTPKLSALSENRSNSAWIPFESFEKGGRPELAAKERKEIEFLTEYLPKPLGRG